MKNDINSQAFTPNCKGANEPDHSLEMVDGNLGTTLSQGLYHQVEDWVALELTAEQMLSDEITVVSTYVADDAHDMWSVIKDTLLPYELAAGHMLLRAADPTQVEWLQNHWWDDHNVIPH